MRRSVPIRLAATASFALAALSPAQSPESRPPYKTPAPSTLPATLPTAPPAAPEQPAPQIPAERPIRRADIKYADGLLSVSADNSSLNQILRDVSRLTGMKITGGIIDERVFGTYGPAEPSQILATLLDGTGSNMLLVQSKDAAPEELVLTPRRGGVTPPNPNASRVDDDNDSQDLPPRRIPMPPQPSSGDSYTAPAPPLNGSRVPPPASVYTPPAPSTDTPSPSPDSTQQQSPNAVKTPQQIYDELQKLRQQQQANPQQANPK
jgi:hypothetical protein